MEGLKFILTIPVEFANPQTGRSYAKSSNGYDSA